MFFLHVGILSTLRSISFSCCDLTENCGSIHIAFTEMNVERYNFLKGLHLQLEHLQHHQNHTLFVGTKNHFELHWYSPQIFYFMLCFPNFFWKLKKPSSEQTWFAGTKIVILSCLLQIPKFSFSSCFYKVFWNWWWPDWMRFECEIEIFATSSKPNLVCKNKNK